LFFFQEEDGIRVFHVTGVQTCALPIWGRGRGPWKCSGRGCRCRWCDYPTALRQNRTYASLPRMRHEKAAQVIELARRMAASAEGLTLEEMSRDMNVGRRTVERMRDAVLELFPQAEEVSDPPYKRWRIRGGLSAFEQAPTTAELVEL